MTSEPSRKRVLIVEDEPDTCIFLTKLLRSGGFDPFSAGGSAPELASALGTRPDLVILDIMLANERGIQIFKSLKADQRLGGVPVILLSAIGRDTFFHYQRFQDVFPNLGIPRPDAYLEKPPEADELLRWARALTAAPQAGAVSGRYRKAGRRKIATEPVRATRPRNP